MNFKLIRHLWLAAFVAELVGFVLHSSVLFWGGVGVLVLSYQFSIHKMEKAFQKVEGIKIEKENNKMSCELVIHIDADGQVFTTLSGDPVDIADAYKYMDQKSHIAQILGNILATSEKETRNALRRS